MGDRLRAPVYKILINMHSCPNNIGVHAEVYFFPLEIVAKPIKMASTSEKK